VTLGACSREKEVAELLRKGQWLQACPAELEAHVAACRACSDLVLVTGSLQQARAHAASVAPLPPPGILWWRAQLRRRNANLERISRPVLGAQIFALAVTLLAAAGFVVANAPHGSSWWTWLEDLPRTLRLEALFPATLFHPTGGLWLLVPTLATLALLGGVAVYLGSEKQ